ncbi:MAG: hypothetical protein Kow0047_25450 [Anaerolineae bacterium]
MKRRNVPADGVIAILSGILALMLYGRTVAPSIVALFDDSLEFQLVLPTLGIAHPTGYPLYTLLGYLFTRLPLGEMAYRANLFSVAAASVAVAGMYLAARELTGHRWAGIAAAAAWASVPVWWSQATIAEVYALHGALQAMALWVIVRWHRGRGALWPAGLLFGLGLAHHRMIVLITPALAVWLVSRWRRAVADRSRALVAAAAPLLLYAYLPLRGMRVTSLDGTYHNSWSGFWQWITASGYDVFLTGNPFAVTRGPHFFAELVLGQLGWPLLSLAFLGLLSLWGGKIGRRADAVALASALAASYAFGVAYRVADVEVFFLPAFMLTTLTAAAGWAAVLRAWDALASRRSRRSWRRWGHAILALIALGWPIARAAALYPEMDRSGEWRVHELGEDILAQPMPEHAGIVGILGEMTLVRYFQQIHGLRPDITTHPADREPERIAAVERLLAEGRAAFLTRATPGAEQSYSLGSVGPLIRVWPKGDARWEPLPTQVDIPMGDAVHLVGYLLEKKPSRLGPWLRVTVHWRAERPIEERLKISLRLATAGNDKIAASDSEPVHAAYPTTSWLAGEIVQDVHDLRIPPSIASGSYEVIIILYRAVDGRELGRASLGMVAIP